MCYTMLRGISCSFVKVCVFFFSGKSLFLIFSCSSFYPIWFDCGDAYRIFKSPHHQISLGLLKGNSYKYRGSLSIVTSSHAGYNVKRQIGQDNNDR